MMELTKRQREGFNLWHAMQYLYPGIKDWDNYQFYSGVIQTDDPDEGGNWEIVYWNWPEPQPEMEVLWKVIETSAFQDWVEGQQYQKDREQALQKELWDNNITLFEVIEAFAEGDAAKLQKVRDVVTKIKTDHPNPVGGLNIRRRNNE